jgi:hypothetical protein
MDLHKLQKWMSPQATSDLNDFLEKMPQNAGNAALIAAGIAWMAAASFGLFATVKVQELTEMRAELKETQAKRPAVPNIRNVPINQNQLRSFVADLERLYPNLVIKQQGSSIFVGAAELAMFGNFREAVGHVQNGGVGWRVTVDNICVGRECRREKLAALLRINKVSVEKR